MKKPTILFADEEAHLHQHLQQHLHQHGCDVILTLETNSILRLIEKKNPDLAVLGTSDSVPVAQQIRRQYPNLPIILLARQSSESYAIDALRAGVNDYFAPPFCQEELTASIERHLRSSSAQIAPIPVAQTIAPKGRHSMIGQSPQMRKIKTYLSNIAATDSTVLITGETGTGKELAAESIHRNSPRHKKPFICINCAALPENLIESELFGYDKGAFTGATATKQGGFEQANGGTVFLDEIGDMNPCAQVKILRTIERKEVHHLGGGKHIPLNVRLIAATNHDPERLVQEGKFREDLYYRLNVARVHLPPLRERKEDLLPLLDHYIRHFNASFDRQIEGLAEQALTLLLKYDWPGNIRELKNLLEATYINLPLRRIRFIDLPEPFRRKLEETKDLPKTERDRILSALFATNWNKSQAAQKLHWSRMTLYRKMTKYQIAKISSLQ